MVGKPAPKPTPPTPPSTGALSLARLPDGQRHLLRAWYDTVVAHALAANPDPPDGAKRYALERASYNLAVARGVPITMPCSTHCECCGRDLSRALVTDQ